MKPDETSPQQRFAHIASSFCGGDEEMAQRLYNYISNLWLSPSSPQLSFGRTKQGLPIACFLPYLPDTTRGLIDTWAEVSELSVIGGGIGLGIGIRQPDEKSVGIIPHLRTYDASCTAFKQGQTRRGSYAAYLDISHPEIVSFLNSRRVSGVGGDYNYKLMNIHNGVNITDSFMRKVWFVSAFTPVAKSMNSKQFVETIDLFRTGLMAGAGLHSQSGNSSKRVDPEVDLDQLTIDKLKDVLERVDRFDLLDPHTGCVFDRVSAVNLWETILVTRAETGEPYLHFIDTSNKHLPKFQKALGLQIRQSNLCVVGETMILTKGGEVPIKSVVGQTKSVWNGEAWSNVYVMQTGVSQELLKVSVSNGKFIVCTPYHKFLVLEEYTTIKDMKRVCAKDLSNGFEILYFYKDLKITTVTVTKINHLTQRANTYCFSELSNHAGVFNGLLTGQCSEIILPTDEHRTAVCCLASLNLDYFDEWNNKPQFYLDVVKYLDNVLQYFIDNAPRTLKRAIYSAESERAIGVGALGFHSYLQSKSIPIESMKAYHLNNTIFKTISSNLSTVNLLLGKTRGEAPDCVGTGRRFSHVMAIAPNATSSIIMGNTSPSCEPFRANVYTQNTISGSYTTYNKHLKKLLSEKINDPTHLNRIYSSIKAHDGSVQHLSILSAHEKEVFKTWPEIDQMVLIRLAAARQRYIDQSQSVSLFFRPDESKFKVHNTHLQAWLAGLKTLYYYRSSKLLVTDKIGLTPQTIDNKLQHSDSNESPTYNESPELVTCTFCEG
jgi:ribonucleotide reductase alpha subunit